jgi:phosphoadenosine phosphosulfate reductase
MASSAPDAPVWRDGGFTPDEWQRFTPENESSTDGPLLVPLADFRADPERFLTRSGQLGVELPAGEAVQELEPYLWKLSLIAVVFPNFHDGRSYSAARLLRERYRFKGELRATGDVLADQIPLMRRCGIDSFYVTHAPTRAALTAGRLAEVRRFYQPIPTARDEVPAGTRPWIRRPAG